MWLGFARATRINLYELAPCKILASGPCSCAVNSRAAWKRRVAGAFQRHGLLVTAGGSTPTYALLARRLGNGGRGLPKELALELPLIFAETLGVWGARVPRSHVERIFGL